MEEATNSNKYALNGYLFSVFRKGSLWLFPLLIILITFVAFIPSLSLYFVHWDDPGYLTENRALEVFSSKWSWQAIGHIFTSDVGANYDPLPIFTFAIEKYFFASDPNTAPFIFHFDNLLLHIGCTLCVFVLFTKMGLKKSSSFICAVLFGIHPMRVESVAWVTERKDVLYGFFYLLAMVTYVNYLQRDNKKKWYLLTVLFAILSFFSKIQAVCLPLSMVAIDYYFNRKWYLPKILILEKLPWWLFSLIFGFINLYFLTKFKVIDAHQTVASYNFLDRFAIGAYAYMTYVLKFIYPYKMLVYYDYPTTLPDAAYFCLAAVPVLIFFLAWKQRQNRAIIFGLAFFTFNVMFMLQILSAGMAFLADRFTYVAYTGLFFIVGWGLEQVRTSAYKMKPLVYVCIGLYCLLLSYKTYYQCKVWENTITLWNHYRDVEPDNYFGYFQLATFYEGVVLNKKQDPYIPQNDTLYIRNSLRNFDIAEYIDSINGRTVPAVTANIFLDHGVACGLAGLNDYAVYYFTRLIAIFPDRKEGYSNRSATYDNEKKYDLAIADLDSCVKIDTADDIDYYKRATIYGKTKQFSNALADINSAIKLKNAYPLYYITRSKLYRAMNNVDSARIDARYAKELGGKVPTHLFE
ncbi:MAG: hypothetical protein P4L41_17970 [Flavipsychrobacter sp.]|nr:hypothetical protein [Flavipsychrobacter sp.]